MTPIIASTRSICASGTVYAAGINLLHLLPSARGDLLSLKFAFRFNMKWRLSAPNIGCGRLCLWIRIEAYRHFEDILANYKMIVATLVVNV